MKRSLKDTIIEGDCVGGLKEVEAMGAMYFAEIRNLLNNGMPMYEAIEEALIRVQENFFRGDAEPARSYGLQRELWWLEKRPG